MGFEIIFYIFAIPALLWEFLNFTSTSKCHGFVNRIKNKEVKVNDKPDDEKFVGVCMLLYLFWVLVGLFSSQYILFLLILTISLIPKKYKIVRFVDSLVSFSIILFIILNKYHFGIDLRPIISDLVTQYVINAPIFK